jgi:hypothetical protein
MERQAQTHNETAGENLQKAHRLITPEEEAHRMAGCGP